MGKRNLSKRILPMALTAAMVFTSVPVMAAPNDLSGHWAEKVMTEWQAKGLIKGYEDGTVKPDNAVSRAEFVIMMNNALGLKGSGKVSFTDVKEGDWYYNAVATAVEAGYCKGYDDGTFKPGATITRAEAAIMIANAAGLVSNVAGAAGFTDAAAIPAWAKGSVGAVVEAGFMSGYPDGTFGAAASIKRAEAVSSLNRVMGNKADTPVVPEEEEKTETENKKGSGGGGGGSSSGGGTRPTVPTVTKTAATAAELDAVIEAGEAGKKLVINVDSAAVLTDENVDATFNGKELTINFNDVDMTGKNLTINAPNAEKISLNDNTAGVGGTEVAVLTINAPNADVVSNVVADTVDIIAVKYGTFHAKDIVNNGIEIKKGAVAVDEAVAATTTVTVPAEATGDVKIAGKVNEVNIETTQEVALDAEVTTANVTAAGATVTGEGSVATANVSAAATIDTKTVETLDVKEPVTVTVGKNAAVDTVVVSAEAAGEAKTEISGSGTVAKIEAEKDVTVSATNVAEVEVGSGVTAELKADVEKVTVPATVTEAPTIKVEEDVTVDTVTTEANVNVTGSGSITNVTVSGSENVTITAPEDSAIKVESVVNTGSGNVEIKNESKNEAELPENTLKAVADTVETVNIDLATSDEWRTEGYVYEFFDISFTGAEWAVEELDWENVTYWVNGEQFQWIPGESVVGDYAVEVDMMDYSYDADTNTGHATGLIAAYEANVEAGETYKGEIRFPSSYLKVEEGYAINSGETFAVDFDVTITESATKLTPAKDELNTITIDVGEADDWITEGYVYVEKEITFDGAEWYMEPYWAEHVTYWIDGEQFQWIPGESVVGAYDVEVDMVPEYDEAGNLSMKAMVFAYVDNVENGDSFDMQIKVPTYSLARTDNNHRITRNETAVIDFTVNIEGCEDYVAPVVDTVEDINIDLSASDEWRTEGYLYQMFDITFNAAEFAVEELDLENITYWVNGKQFIWGEDSKPGDFAVEADVFDYSYDEESETGYAPGLIAAFVENVAVDEVYEVEIHFPSNQLRITKEGYGFKNGETVVVDFNVHIVDSEEELEPAKDQLNEIEIDLTTADDWQTDGYVYVTKEITFDAARWIREPYWDHVTYWIDGKQFQWTDESRPGDYAVEVDMVPNYDDEGNLSMTAMAFAYVENVKDGDSFDVEIKVPTYSLERTDDNHRITRDETAVIDFTVNITGSAPVVEDFYAEVTDTVINCEIDNDEGTVTEGTITVDFAFENYTEAVRFGLMNDDGETATEKVFTRENADDTTGSVTFNMTGRPATKYEVVYQIGEEWYKTGEYIYMVTPEDAFAVTKVTGTEVHCSDNGEMVESGTITVTFTFKNYADAVKFGLMEHCDNDEDIVATEATYTRANESETEGSVTFAMTGVPVANYEVVYYLADVDKWVGTNEYIDLTKTDEPAVSTTITLTQNGNQVFASWEDCGCERYTWAFLDSTGDVEELQWTNGNECVTWDIVPLIPRVESGTAAYDFVVYELDENDEDWIGEELGRLEDAIVVTASGNAVGYTMEFTDAANGKYRITLEDVPAVNDVFLNMWTKTNGHAYCSEYFSDGGQSYEETTFMGALTEGDVYDLRKVSFNVTDNKLNVAMTPASETTYGAAVEEPDEEVNFMLNGSGNDFYMTWNDMEYSGYRIDIGDNKIWITDGSNKSRNLLRFIPCADESATYDIVLKGLDEEYNTTELARLEDALEVTVSGSAAEYTAVFGETSVNVTWTAEGIGEIHEVKNSDGTLLSVGGGSVTPTHTINYNNNYTVANGDVLDMRVVTNASMDDQVLTVTITPASETTYVVEDGDEPTTEEMTVDVTLTEDTVVVMPAVSPSVKFSFENLTEATTISTYVVTTKGVSEADAIEVKTQDVSAGTKYATIGLYSATFNEVGTYYVYYKVGNGAWCKEPLEITVTEPTEPTVSLKASYIEGTVGEDISENVKIELKNDTFSVEMKAGTDVTAWFTNMPENWTATVAEDVAVGATLMVVTIACDADKTAAGSGYPGVTVPADVLKAGNALTAAETFAYKVEAAESGVEA